VSWLVDTNVLSELRRGERCHPGVREWFNAVEDEELFTSALVIGELRRGVESIRRRDPRSAAVLTQWLLRLTESYGDRILEVDVEVAERWGVLNVPDPLPSVDGLLAATALVHGLTLVTRNVRDVRSTGVRLLDPFSM